jgi:hypothetical protein
MLQELALKYDRSPVVIPVRDEVLPHALAAAGDSDLVLITGSLSIVGDFRSLWFEKKG